jgi:hypothetical protein
MPDHSTSLKTRYEEILPPADLVEQTKAGIEIWRPIAGTDEWYEVSNLGNARTWKKNPGRSGVLRRLAEPRPLTPTCITGGYLAITLRHDGRQFCVLVHAAMAEAFIGPRPGHFRLWQAAHADDIPTNNSLDNIRWCTAKANCHDRTKNRRKTGSLRECQERDGVAYYQCTGCGEWKPKDRFTALRTAVTICGIQSKCRACSTADRKKYKRTRKPR